MIISTTRKAGRSSPFGRRLIILIIIISGIGISLNAAFNLHDELTKENWPTVTGQIIGVEIVGIRAFHPLVTYRYNVNKIEYESTRHLEAPGFGGKRKRWDVAEKTAALYKPGTKVDIYFNPNDPAESRLIVGPAYGMYLQLALGLLLFIIGFAFLNIISRGARYRQS